MSRKKEFSTKSPEKLVLRDSRFGLRQIYLNPNEKPSIAVFNKPGRGPNGEHQS